MSNDIEREAFEAEMGRIFKLDDETLRKLPSQRVMDEKGTEVYEGWEDEEAARTFSVAWQVWKAARAQPSGGIPEGSKYACQNCETEWENPANPGQVCDACLEARTHSEGEAEPFGYISRTGFDSLRSGEDEYAPCFRADLCGEWINRVPLYTHPSAGAVPDFDAVVSPAILKWAKGDNELLVRRIWDEVRRALLTAAPTAHVEGGGVPEEKTAERVVRAFWRRIYPYRNNYGKELPDDCPVEFVANMATALCALTVTHNGEQGGEWFDASGTSGNLPEIGQPVMGYHPAWVDEDFCKDGIRECFLFGDGSEWQSARWDGYSDQWIVEDGAPALWHPHPNPPTEREGE
ncbi:hypothetical protein ACJO2E_02665 [Marinobacter sp. M1N3S26]|uniref:hypothetical protein n=1 Tax=Marinobacter sp. M1N3S26 TaxID=3382299 RepID=UPI00387B9B81